MFAKQTSASASLFVVLACVTSVAHAEGTFEIGAGYLPYEGFIAHSGVENRYLKLETDISRWREDFRASVVTPEAGGLRLRAELFASTHELPGFTREGVGGALTLEQTLTPNLVAFAGVRVEELKQPQPASLRTLRAGLVYTSERTIVGLSYDIADQRLGSDTSFDRVHAWFAHRERLGPLTLRLSGSAVHMMGDVPTSERVFIDGVNDIRGYLPGELAPLGATTKASGRVELEVPLWKKAGLYAVGFADAGMIGDDRSLATGVSAGAGLRWRTPIGTLGVDYAVPLDGGAPKLLFSVGGTW
jgi:hypothetical protein